MKRIIFSIIFITAIAGLVLFVSNKSNKVPVFKTIKVIKGAIVETVTASGTVNPVTNITVGSQVSGTISKLYVDFNSPVKKGQILAQIDPSLFQAQVEQAKANLYSAQANYNNIKSTLLNDEKTYDRDKELLQSNFIARSQYDLDLAAYQSYKAQLEGSKAQIKQATAALSNSETNLRYTKIVSPVDGIVVSRNVDVGQTVAASFQTPTLFSVAQDLTKMQIDTTVAEADIGKIKVGQKISFTVDGYPDMTFYGRVKQIRIAPTTVSNVVTYDVVINVNNKDLKLIPGMTANVSIITSNKKDILLIPNESLRFTPFDDIDAPKYKKQGVWVLKGTRPRRITIVPGASDGTNTEIVSGNINIDDKIIVGRLEKHKKHGAPQGMGHGPF